MPGSGFLKVWSIKIAFFIVASVWLWNSDVEQQNYYCKVVSSNSSRLEAHEGFFRLLMKGIFDPYVL